MRCRPSRSPRTATLFPYTTRFRSGAVVLDPFFGTGTTGAVAKRLGRHYIGIDREPRYCRVARERIEGVLPLDESAMVTMQSKRAATRIPFGALVENGLIQPGATRSEEHTSELQPLMRISYAVFCLQKKNHQQNAYTITHT